MDISVTNTNNISRVVKDSDTPLQMSNIWQQTVVDGIVSLLAKFKHKSNITGNTIAITLTVTTIIQTICTKEVSK